MKACPICNKEMYLANLKIHILRDHEKKTPFHCDLCTRRFAMESGLKWHKKFVHERVKCDICNEEICNSFMLKRHKAKAHGIKPANVLECEHCPLFFHNKGNLEKHVIKKHSEI